MKYELRTKGGMTAYVCGAAQGTDNIGDSVVKRFAMSGWNAIGDDCAVGDGSRPAGGNIPNAKVAAKHGYNETDKGWYQRFEAPSVDNFKRTNPDALVVTLGKTYKGHFAEIPEWEVRNMIHANLVLPLECVRRFVYATRDDTTHYAPRWIVLTGSYAHDHPFTNGTLYCAAKAGIDMAARTLGWELTDLGYRVFVVHPYHVQGTPMWAQVERDVMATKGMTWEEADAYNRKDLKMPDLLTAKQVAEVIETLITNPAMGWLSGQPIKLYGGSR
jgi:NAD(P)-dependent dehydrogenase (short-subunit alcohol dehydrogenase family)